MNQRHFGGKCVSRRHSPTVFGENVVVAKIRLPNVKSLIILRLREGLTSFNKNDRANFFGAKSTMKRLGGSLSLFFFQNTQKNLKLYLVLAVGPVLES